MIRLFTWLARIVLTLILWQTLYFKFSAHPESVALFSKLHAEPWGRWFVGIAELIAGVLLILPATVEVGALLSMGLMLGAITSHLLVIGIESQDDGGYLFMLANICLLLSLFIAYTQQHKIRSLLSRFTRF